jgi:Fe-S-cluster containining protein
MTPPPPPVRDPDDPSACRPGCGACCIAPSISSPLPGMPNGKRAGERCAHLSAAMTCELFGRPGRPAVCAGLKPGPEMCGTSRAHALAWLAVLEASTRPA